MKKRRRAERSGTAGGRIGWTLMPRSNKARDRRKALTELPTMTGTTGVPAAEPVSRPRSLTSFRNSVANSRSRSTRRGSRWRTVRAATAAAAPGGGGAPAATGQRLGERAHPQVDVGAGHAPVLAETPAGRPDGAQRVRFIDQQQRLVLLPEFHEAWQIGEVAI